MPGARCAPGVGLGGTEQVKGQVREARAGHFLGTRWQDLRFAFRTLRKSPVFSLTVVLVLVGVRVTADSVLDVVVEVAGSFTTVVQDEKTSAQAGIRRRLRDSFFIVVGVYANTPDSTPNGLANP